jgi:hypothetical protein
MQQRDIESILWDCVNTPTEDDSYLGYQTSGISKLAELIVEQDRRIGELESKVAELTDARTVKQEGELS